MSCTDSFFRPVVEIVAEGRSNLAFQFNGRNKLAFVDNQQIPKLGWPKETGQREDSAFLMDIGMGESVGVDNIEYQSDKPVHVFTSGHTSTLTPVGLARFNLLLSGSFPVFPKLLHRFTRFALIVHKVNCHCHSPLLYRADRSS